MKAPKKLPLASAPIAAEHKPRLQRGWLHGFVLAGLFLANMALYQGTFRLGFLSVDDPDYVQNNPYIENFKAENLKFILTQPYAANYAPANLLSYALDVAVAKGKSPVAVHISSVLWHGWVVCAVYFLAFTIFPSIPVAAAAAVLFMLHPAHVEVVAWISSRKDLVATGFAAVSMACYLRYRRRAGRKDKEGANSTHEGPNEPQVPATKPWGKWACYAGSIVSFLLASGGKQSVLLLPIVMLIWDLLVEQRRDWRMLADKVPFGVLVIFFGLMTWHAQPPTRMPHNLFVMAATQLTNLWLLTGLGKYVLYRNAPDPTAWSALARFGIIGAALVVWVLPLLLFMPRLPGTKRKLGQSADTSVRQTAGSALSPSINIPRPTPFSILRSPLLAALSYWVLVQMLPPLAISFVVPITDRYLFLPSVGICILLAAAFANTGLVRKTAWISWPLLVLIGGIWGAKTWNYVNEWRDPRSVWYGAHLKTRNSQVFQFLGEVYHNAGDRINDFVKSGSPLQVTNEVALARAVLGDEARVEQLESEWRKTSPTRTNSIAYRDELWRLAWDEYEVSVARRGTLSTPNLFMNRGRLLVGEGKHERAIPEFKAALAFAETSSYDVVRQESAVHAMRGIGVAYWSLRNYREARDWFLKAQKVQQKSGRAWIATLDDEVRRVTALAEAQK